MSHASCAGSWGLTKLKERGGSAPATERLAGAESAVAPRVLSLLRTRRNWSTLHRAVEPPLPELRVWSGWHGTRCGSKQELVHTSGDEGQGYAYTYLVRALFPSHIFFFDPTGSTAANEIQQAVAECLDT